MNNKDLPAYPQPIVMSDNGIISTIDAAVSESGLTKREMIAAMCLQGLMSGVNPDDITFNSMDSAIDAAVQAADKLLTHLENTSK